MAEVSGMSLAELVVASAGVELYVMGWGDQDSTDGLSEALCMVVMKRAGGLILALPLDFLPEDVLAEGELADDQFLFGLSKVVEVAGAMVQDQAVVPIGVPLQVLLVDCGEEILGYLRKQEIAENFVIRFSVEDPEAFPLPSAMVAATFDWLRQEVGAERAALYSPEVTAESGEETPAARGRRPKAGARPDGPMPTVKPKPKQKKPTAANLASQLDTVTETLQSLIARQERLEESVQNPTAAALQRPLASQLVQQKSSLGTVASMVGSPPRVRQRGVELLVPQTSAPPELLELQLEKKVPVEEGGDLASAMLAQSAALTTLVAQLASGHSDPMNELALPMGSGTRGAQGRARLQLELASQKGIFFDSVMRQMARRMSPTMSPEMTPQQALAQGICGTKYLERFGGYGRHKDLGVIQYQVMTCMDFLQTENWPAARDTMALLAVMLEQSVLDNGRLDLGQILTLADDPPSAIFSNRQSQVSRARAFAPLADQKWITTALAYVKELDTISLELIAGTSTASGSGDVVLAGDPPKPKPKKKGRRKGAYVERPTNQEEN